MVEQNIFGKKNGWTKKMKPVICFEKRKKREKKNWKKKVSKKQGFRIFLKKKIEKLKKKMFFEKKMFP